MSHRFLIYPLLFVVLLQLLGLLRNEPRWFIGQIIPRVLILIACGFGLLESHHQLWISIAWGLCFWQMVLPKWAAQSAMGWLIAGELPRAAKAWHGAAWFVWGPPARYYRTFATALQLWSTGQEDAAKALLDQFNDPAVPDSVRGEYHLWHLYLLTANREWQAAIEFYESADTTWSPLSVALQARLAAARAYAELGQFLRAIQCLHFVASSTQTIGALEMQLWTTRVCVTALAGDQVELEWLLARKAARHKRGQARFVAVWRGRCAATQGDREEAGVQLARALALTPPSLAKSRQVISGYLDNLPSEATAPDESWHQGFLLLREADAQMSTWRALMGWGNPPPVTFALLVLLTIVFVADQTLSYYKVLPEFYRWGGNVPLKDLAGQWWRPVTALFLHATWLHLLLNGAALWMFGAAIEKMMGWVRLVVIFLVAGTVANLMSAYRGGFDVSIGASGAVFGLVAAFGVAVYHLKSPIHPAVKRRLLLTLALMLSVDLTIGGLETQIDNAAHIGGFIVGLLVALLAVPRERQTTE